MHLERAINQPKIYQEKLFQPILAWLPILTFILITAGLLIVKFSSPLNLIFPVGATLTAFFLYSKSPILYLGFSWWVWFISPFISRLVEYQNGLVDPDFRLIILAPYLVTGISGIRFLEKLPSLISEGGAPFILAFVSIAYSFIIGIAKGNPIVSIGQDLLSWVVGVFLGAYFLDNWRHYPEIRKNIRRVFFWGVLVMGIYGIYQYVVAPEWDKYWLRNAKDLQLCCGWPEPFEIRVWSTLNYPFTFSYAMMACLLVLFGEKNNSKLPAILAGLAAFLLAQVRGAWLGFFFGLTTFFVSVKSSLQLRLILTFFVIGIFLIALGNSTPEAQEVIQRLQTLGNIGSDHSANERAGIYAQIYRGVISDFFGRGMGGKSIVDAGALSVLATLGWMGVIPYITAVVLVFYSLFQDKLAAHDPFAIAARAIVVSVFVSLPFNNVFFLMPGMLFWSFAGIGMAAHKHAKHFGVSA